MEKKKYDEISSDEHDDFMELMTEQKRALRKTISCLRKKGDPELTQKEWELVMVKNTEIAYNANKIAVAPPSEETIAKVITMVKDLDNLIANATNVQTVISAADKISKIWKAHIT